jgi:hypothetical protein
MRLFDFWIRPGGFNPRPSLATGATSGSAVCGDGERVSIRAPASRLGRPNVASRSVACVRFQSAPQPRDWGDTPENAVAWGILGFNPRPSLATGATWLNERYETTNKVSIRAPASRLGRRKIVSKRDWSHWFQSAPQPRDWGDCGLCFRLGRREFVAHFRQPANPSCFDRDENVKEPSEASDSPCHGPIRETPGFRLALRVRGSWLIAPAAR